MGIFDWLFKPKTKSSEDEVIAEIHRKYRMEMGEKEASLEAENRFKEKAEQLEESSGRPISNEDVISELCNSKNLVDGKTTHEFAKTHKDDIDMMKRCCQAELVKMEKAEKEPDMYYFRRVAILSRKGKNYKQEIEYCKLYIRSIKEYYDKYGFKNMADVRKGKTYKNLVERQKKARELMKKSRKK